MKHVLPQLPFAEDALAPALSTETLQYHYGKHHKTYVETLNKLIPGTEFENMELEQIIRRAPEGKIFNNAAQAWNHNFYWNSLSPGRPKAQGSLLRAIERDFGGMQQFFENFRKEAKDLFGSGWVWLVQHDVDGRLSLMSTGNADNPVRIRLRPLLTCDVWEHAYYIDYRNDRGRYLEQVENYLNWDFAARNFRETAKAAA